MNLFDKWSAMFCDVLINKTWAWDIGLIRVLICINDKTIFQMLLASNTLFRSTKVPLLALRLNVPTSCLVLQPIFFFHMLVHCVLCFFSCSDSFELQLGCYGLMVSYCAGECLLLTGSQVQPPVIQRPATTSEVLPFLLQLADFRAGLEKGLSNCKITLLTLAYWCPVRRRGI